MAFRQIASKINLQAHSALLINDYLYAGPRQQADNRRPRACAIGALSDGYWKFAPNLHRWEKVGMSGNQRWRLCRAPTDPFSSVWGW